MSAMLCLCECVSLLRATGSSSVASRRGSSRGHQDDCHQPLNVRRSRSACGLTVVTKCADVVVTLKRQSWLNDAGYLCGNQPVRRRRGGGVEDDAMIQHERAVKF